VQRVQENNDRFGSMTSDESTASRRWRRGVDVARLESTKTNQYCRAQNDLPEHSLISQPISSYSQATLYLWNRPSPGVRTLNSSKCVLWCSERRRLLVSTLGKAT